MWGTNKEDVAAVSGLAGSPGLFAGGGTYHKPGMDGTMAGKKRTGCFLILTTVVAPVGEGQRPGARVEAENERVPQRGEVWTATGDDRWPGGRKFTAASWPSRRAQRFPCPMGNPRHTWN